MTDSYTSFWTARETDASFSPPMDCEARATAFERKIGRRNSLELIAGAFVVLDFGASAGIFATAGEWVLAVGPVLTVLAALFVIAKLYRDGSIEARRPEDSCVGHLRRQLVRQRDLLRSVPKWYLAPFLPGMLGFYLAFAAKDAAVVGWSAALGHIWVNLAGTAALFVFIAWLNLNTARNLDRQIAALDMA